MLKPRVLLAQARAPFIHAHIAAVQGLALRVSASPAIIPRFANPLASFDLAHRAKGVALDLSLPVSGRRRWFSGPLALLGLRNLG